MYTLKCLIILSLTTILTMNVVDGEFKSYEGYKIFSIFPENENDLEYISTIIQNSDLDVWSSVKMIHRPTDIMVPPKMQNEFIEKLNSSKLSYNITIDNVQRLINQERRQSKNIVTTNYNVEKYLKYSEINDYIKYLQTNYPNLIRIINIGKSYEGRDLNIVHISSEFETNSSKPAILIEGGVHAREWIAPAQVLFIIHQLVEIDKNKWLIDNVDWYLIPTLNPDGYDYTFKKDRFWRKTRSKISARCVGVDMNRNYDYKWRPSRFCGDSYSGKHSFSEPELKAYAKFAETIKDQLKLYLAFHSYGELILYPWSYTYFEYPNNYQELKEIAEKVGKLIGLKYSTGTPAQLIYTAHGSCLDWFKGVLGVDLVYAIELSPGRSGQVDGVTVGFDLPPKKIKEVVMRVFRGVSYLGAYVKKKYV